MSWLPLPFIERIGDSLDGRPVPWDVERDIFSMPPVSLPEDHAAIRDVIRAALRVHRNSGAAPKI